MWNLIYLCFNTLIKLSTGGSAGYVMVAAQDMWWWWRRICGGGGAGYVVVVAQDMWWFCQIIMPLCGPILQAETC